MTVEDYAVLASLRSDIPIYPSYSKAMVAITNAAKGGINDYIQLVIWNRNLTPPNTVAESAVIEAIRMARRGLRSTFIKKELSDEMVDVLANSFSWM